MTTRGINFLDRWMADHLPNAITEIQWPSFTSSKRP
ncbi:DUF768 domain-containing protein [Mesorhizobium sp. M1A.F.Ca.IN.022.07.1.1]|nr:DUF768 domain-containing protein [Mesorhizobium sp. M1A.F.Ca.IN.022.07.1.1]